MRKRIGLRRAASVHSVQHSVEAGRALRAWNRRCGLAQPCTVVRRRAGVKCLLCLDFSFSLHNAHYNP